MVGRAGQLTGGEVGGHLVAHAVDDAERHGRVQRQRDDLLADLLGDVQRAPAELPEAGVEMGRAPVDAGPDAPVGEVLPQIVPDGRIDAGPYGLGFPSYTAAEVSWCFVLKERTPEGLRAGPISS